MKKVLILLALMIGIVFPIMAQTGGEVSTSFVDYFTTLAALAGLNVIVAAAVIQLFKNKELTKLVKQLISVGTAVILCTVGYLMQLGIFAGVEWWWIIVYTVGVAFPSNGFFDIIKALIISLSKKK